MTKTTKKLKQSKIATIIGSVLLIIMAFFHGSGIIYISEQIQLSDAKSFLKDIFPVLFAHPSIHLLGLAALGILTLSMSQEIKKVLFAIAALILIDALIAFYLGAIIPGGLLLFATACFVFGGIQKKI